MPAFPSLKVGQQTTRIVVCDKRGFDSQNTVQGDAVHATDGVELFSASLSPCNKMASLRHDAALHAAPTTPRLSFRDEDVSPLMLASQLLL
jgi:hypothetical protein